MTWQPLLQPDTLLDDWRKTPDSPKAVMVLATASVIGVISGGGHLALMLAEQEAMSVRLSVRRRIDAAAQHAREGKQLADQLLRAVEL